MTEINVDEVGPVDYLVVAFPADNADFSGAMASELKALIDSNTIRVLDLVMIIKGEDGSVEASELRDADDSEVGELRALERDLAILLAEDDIEEIGASLEPGSAAAVLVWENTWAAPFGSAVRNSGGELLTSGRIPTQALIAAVEADRQAGTKGARRWDCSEREAIDPACSEVASGVAIDAMTAATAARTDTTTGATGGMTAAIAVADPGCYGASSPRRPRSKPMPPSPLSRRMRPHGSVTP
jgi:hypothetical protein